MNTEIREGAPLEGPMLDLSFKDIAVTVALPLIRNFLMSKIDELAVEAKTKFKIEGDVEAFKQWLELKITDLITTGKIIKKR